MTTITLEVPDELAARLAPLRDQLPGLISQALELRSAEKAAKGVEQQMSHPVFVETLDFLASGPTPEQIMAFKASSAAQERLDDLLDKNREEGLTEDEEADLDVYEQVNDLMILLKAHTRTVQALAYLICYAAHAYPCRTASYGD
ncbi:MAG: hypothetical protein WKF84_00390 [Pyrinomonadaceae bacterium]